MITGGQEQAYDEIFKLVKDALEVVDGITIIYQDDLANVDVDGTVVTVRLQHMLGRQASLAGEDGRRKWNNDGLIFMQARCPAKDGGLTAINYLTKICVEAIRGKTTPGGVWFRNVVGKEEAPKDGNSRMNVTGEFTYQEIS
jgi:hypothetical protein